MVGVRSVNLAINLATLVILRTSSRPLCRIPSCRSPNAFSICFMSFRLGSNSWFVRSLNTFLMLTHRLKIGVGWNIKHCIMHYVNGSGLKSGPKVAWTRLLPQDGASIRGSRNRGAHYSYFFYTEVCFYYTWQSFPQILRHQVLTSPNPHSLIWAGSIVLRSQSPQVKKRHFS